MLVARALFWIIAVSLLLAGGNGVSGRYGDRPGAEYVGVESPAYFSATRVVSSVSQLDGWCNSHTTICAAASTTGHLGLEIVDRAMGAVLSREASAADGPRRAVSGSGHIDTPRYRNNEALFDGLADLLYDEDEELEDVG